MNRFNFNFKDRKVLYLFFCIVIVSVFTLTVAYSALNAVLNISGSAQVSSSDWDIYLDNINVTSGSVSGNAPTITSAVSASFSTTLTMPGDFYEFSIDIVNDGSIDAMINSVNKTPTLSATQAKYLKYEITYQNGEAINTKQLVEKKSFVRLMVRVEFRNDLSGSDLPSTTETLNLGFTVDYIQSDGSGSSVNNNGTAMSNPKFAVGDEFCFGEECFYVLKDDGTTVTAITKYNLEVGQIVTGPFMYQNIPNASGIQSIKTLNSSYLLYGAEFFDMYYIDVVYDSYPVDADISLYYISTPVYEYKSYIESLGVNVLNARLITLDELYELGCNANNCEDSYDFIKQLSYWTSTIVGERINIMVDQGVLFEFQNTFDDVAGVRPVLEFATSDF